MIENDSKKMVLTPEEVRKRLGIGRGLMYEALRRGTIPHLRVGRKILIPVASLERLLGSKTHEGGDDGRR